MNIYDFLVLEDDALIGELLSDMLIEMGHTVCCIASTVSEAVTAAAHHKPTKMIVDAQLGFGSGVDAVDIICVVNPVPYLYVTGDLERLLKLRPKAVIIQKPFRELDLTDGIKRAVEEIAIYH